MIGVMSDTSAAHFSIQRAAVWLLDRYYSDFPVYNPAVPNLPKSILSKKMTGFKVYSLDGKYKLFTAPFIHNHVFSVVTQARISAVILLVLASSFPVFYRHCKLLICTPPLRLLCRKPSQQLHRPVKGHDSSRCTPERQLPQRVLL